VAKFFVNRPIVAMVISIIMILVGVVALKGLPIAQYPEITPPEIMLLATYTGASAVNVEQTTATPIEQQLNGVERSIYLRSINANDGTMQLRATFEVGSDLDIANVLVQNRFSQAEPLLPEDVKRIGVTVRKSLTFPLLLISLTSPNGGYNGDFLNNYAAINVIDAWRGSRVSAGAPHVGRRVRHADLGPPRSAGDARHHSQRYRQRGEAAERADPRRSGRRPASPFGPAIHLHRAGRRPAGHARAVRRDRRPHQPGWLAGPPA
jgi:hypothetical protein